MPSDLPFTFNGLLQLIEKKGFMFVLALIGLVGMAGISWKVYGQQTELLSGMQELKLDHSHIAPQLEDQKCNTIEGNRIACANCWNVATSQEELQRCACDPKPDANPCRLH